MASGSTFISGALKFMAWTKIKTAAVVVVSLLVVGGITTVVVKKVQLARRQARYVERRLHLWPAERKLEAERIKGRQENDETVNATTIDLRPYVNAKLTDAPVCRKGNNDDN